MCLVFCSRYHIYDGFVIITVRLEIIVVSQQCNLISSKFHIMLLHICCINI